VTVLSVSANHEHADCIICVNKGAVMVWRWHSNIQRWLEM